MALHWNVTDVKKPDLWVKGVELPMGGWRKPTADDPPEKIEEFLNPITEQLIWATLAVDMGKITAENWRDFYIRLKLYETLTGPLWGGSSDILVTPEMIKEHIGLSTNVSTTTWPKYKKKVDDWAKRYLKD